MKTHGGLPLRCCACRHSDFRMDDDTAGVKRAGQSFSIGNLYREDRSQPDTFQ